jgi:hypothetical protein
MQVTVIERKRNEGTVEEIKIRRHQICINLSKALETMCQKSRQHPSRPAVLAGAEFSNIQRHTLS